MSSAVHQQNHCLFYDPKIEGQISQDGIKNLFNNVKEIDVINFKDQKWFVIEIPKVQTTNPNFFSTMCRIASYVEPYGLKFAVIGHEKIGQLIAKNGIERIVNFADSAESFYKNNQIESDRDSARIFLNCLLESAMTTMKVLLNLQDVKTEVQVLTDPTKIPIIQAGAMAGIISNHFTGNLVIGFSIDVFKKAMAAFLQMEVTQVTAEMKDGAAEFLNVIIGQTKTKLNEVGFNIREVIPSVIIGEKIEISSVSKQSYVMIKCLTTIGDIHIILTTSPNKKTVA